jgi:hypothetical protein
MSQFESVYIFLAVISGIATTLSTIYWGVTEKRVFQNAFMFSIIIFVIFGSLANYYTTSSSHDVVLQYIGPHSEQVVVRHPNGTIEVIRGN